MWQHQLLVLSLGPILTHLHLAEVVKLDVHTAGGEPLLEPAGNGLDGRGGVQDAELGPAPSPPPPRPPAGAGGGGEAEGALPLEQPGLRVPPALVLVPHTGTRGVPGKYL